MYALDQEVIDLRSGNIATIVDIQTNSKGTLYTVQYGDTEYRRYYDFKFNKFFVEISGETYQKPAQDYTNVVFMDFFNKSKFTDVDSWLQWLNISRK